MNVPFVGRAIDERFLTHRLRSTSFAGIVGGVVALGLFAYRYYIDHILSWDLLAVGVSIVAVKVTLMIWYHFTD
jgi:hypothetical protein